MKKFLILLCWVLISQNLSAQQFSPTQTIKPEKNDAYLGPMSASGSHLFINDLNENNVFMYEKNKKGQFVEKQKVTDLLHKSQLESTNSHVAGDHAIITDGPLVHILGWVNGKWKETSSIQFPTDLNYYEYITGRIAPSGAQVQLSNQYNDVLWSYIYELINGEWKNVYSIRTGVTAFSDNVAIVSVPNDGQHAEPGIYIYEKKKMVGSLLK